MSARLTDSQMYHHLWGTPGTRAIFTEEARLRCWIDILVALAQAQAELGYIPAGAAEAIRAHARVERLDLQAVGRETRRGAISRTSSAPMRSRRPAMSRAADSSRCCARAASL